jgi:hypothetical protein
MSNGIDCKSQQVIQVSTIAKRSEFDDCLMTPRFDIVLSGPEPI